ncbi:MAG: LacI family transcriptional regulator, partial [Planctomycetes bacterium]|nr:LacI family transcriptional regulator [Planctomycetota bacterium]
KKTQEAVLSEAKRLDFSPNQLARSLRLQKTHTLGLVIPDISNPFFASLARFVELEARKSGYAVFLCDSEERTDVEVESLRLMQGRKVDGIIISPVGQSGDHLTKLHEAGLPIVIADRHFPRMTLPYVTSDNFNGALDGVSYLIDNGHTRIACIQGIPDSVTNLERVRGYRAALEQHQVASDPAMIVGDSFSQRNGYLSTKLLLECEPPPTAIFSLGNQMTFGALQALAEEGLCVPEDMSILSFDEQPYFAFLATPITTIAQQNETMGQIAVSLLLEQIENEDHRDAEGIMLPTTLIRRDSVRMLG